MESEPNAESVMRFSIPLSSHGPLQPLLDPRAAHRAFFLDGDERTRLVEGEKRIERAAPL